MEEEVNDLPDIAHTAPHPDSPCVHPHGPHPQHERAEIGVAPALDGQLGGGVARDRSVGEEQSGEDGESDERLEQELPALFIIVVATGRAKQRLLGRVVHV